MKHDAMALYFIALIPPLEVGEQIKALQAEIKERFGIKNVSKSPPHITLQMPFNKEEGEEANLMDTLYKFAEQQNGFKVMLSGFGCFHPHVIFVRVVDHGPIVAVHDRLKKELVGQLNSKEEATINEIHPHITVIARNLNHGAFHKIWPAFENRKFKASFLVNSIHLLKHNGTNWDAYKEFFFKKEKGNN